MADLYLRYRERIREAIRPLDFERIIASAYRDYVQNYLTEKEYGRIYFACIVRNNKLD